MPAIGLFHILLVTAFLLGLFVVIRVLRMPKDFFNNQTLFKDVRKKLRQKHVDETEAT